MFEKDKNMILYTREHYTFAESLYENYIKMRRAGAQFLSPKYGMLKDDFINSDAGKEGFLAGVYIMLSLYGDM